jgi:hypothetical protein
MSVPLLHKQVTEFVQGSYEIRVGVAAEGRENQASQFSAGDRHVKLVDEEELQVGL